MDSIKGVWGLFLVGVLLVVLGGCGGDEGGGTYACAYEERSTDGCDGYGWMEWETDCFVFNADDYYITPEQVCSNYTESELYCQSSCCIDYQFRNVSLTQGSCP